jgi:hypothetical protein
LVARTFKFDVTVVHKGTVSVKAETAEEAEAMLYDMDLDLPVDEMFAEGY